MIRTARRWFIRLTVGPLLLVIAHVLVFRYAPVPLTPLMVIRWAQGHGFSKDWVAMDEMSPHLARSVIAAEDNRFCEHDGIDWSAVGDVVQEYRADGRLRGASTVSMQTVKNLYLWPSRSVIRKGLEAGLVHVLEAAWSKERIMEVYLNIAEMGPGIYGVQAASQHHFGRDASALTFVQSASLVAILPAPLKRDPTHRNRAMGKRVGHIRRSVRNLGPLLDCVPPAPTRSRAVQPASKPTVPQKEAAEPVESEAVEVPEPAGEVAPAKRPAAEEAGFPTHSRARRGSKRDRKKRKKKLK